MNNFRGSETRYKREWKRNQCELPDWMGVMYLRWVRDECRLTGRNAGMDMEDLVVGRVGWALGRKVWENARDLALCPVSVDSCVSVFCEERKDVVCGSRWNEKEILVTRFCPVFKFPCSRHIPVLQFAHGEKHSTKKGFENEILQTNSLAEAEVAWIQLLQWTITMLFPSCCQFFRNPSSAYKTAAETSCNQFILLEESQSWEHYFRTGKERLLLLVKEKC